MPYPLAHQLHDSSANTATVSFHGAAKKPETWEASSLPTAYDLLVNDMSDYVSSRGVVTKYEQTLMSLLRSSIEEDTHGAALARQHLLNTQDPDAILDVALKAYRRTPATTWIEYVVAILEAFGVRAWPTVERWIQSDTEELEYLVVAIPNFPQVSLRDRVVALQQLGMSEHFDVVEAVVEEAARLPSDSARSVLEGILTHRNDDLSDMAREELDGLSD